jgi:actin-related protein 6
VPFRGPVSYASDTPKLTRIRENPKKNSIVQEYVLPDFSAKSASTTGYIRSGPNAAPPPEMSSKQTKASNIDEEEQVLWMSNERFQGPELLFNPSDIGKLASTQCIGNPADCRP